jgi:hypothetical protein
MRTWIRRLQRLAFAAAVLAGLGFGAKQAVASAGGSTAGDCQGCPWPSQTECVECCQKLMFDDGLCTMSGACLCF